MVCLFDPTIGMNRVCICTLYTHPVHKIHIFSEGSNRQTMTPAPVILPSSPILV